MDATSFGGTHRQSPWRQRPAECGGPTTTGAGQKSLAVINYLYTHTHTTLALPPPHSSASALHHKLPRLRNRIWVKSKRSEVRGRSVRQQTMDEWAWNTARERTRETKGKGRREGESELVLARQCERLFTQSRGRVCQAGDCSLKY